MDRDLIARGLLVQALYLLVQHWYENQGGYRDRYEGCHLDLPGVEGLAIDLATDAGSCGPRITGTISVMGQEIEVSYVLMSPGWVDMMTKRCYDAVVVE